MTDGSDGDMADGSDGTARTRSRAEIADALRDAVAELKKERESHAAQLAGLAGQLDEAIRAIEGILQDCAGIPRIAVLGVTGVGKTTLINQLFGAGVARVDATRPTTMATEIYPYPPPDGDRFEVCDTRGLGEVAASREAREQLECELLERRPHLLTYLIDAGRRDAIDQELRVVVDLVAACEREFMRRPGLLFVLTRCDAISPSGFDKLPTPPWEEARAGEPEVAGIKRERLRARVKWFREQLGRVGLPGGDAVVSCALEWAGTSRRHWNLDQVNHALFRQAPVGLLVGLGDSRQLEARLESLAREIVRRFAQIASGVALNPLPISDTLVLAPLQYCMVRVISSFRRRGTLEPLAFLAGCGITGVAGRWAAGQLVGLLPGLGTVLKAGVAGGITYALGEIAIRHYVHGETPDARLIASLRPAAGAESEGR